MELQKDFIEVLAARIYGELKTYTFSATFDKCADVYPHAITHAILERVESIAADNGQALKMRIYIELKQQDNENKNA